MEPAATSGRFRLARGYRWCAAKRQWLRPGVKVPKDITGVEAFCSVQKSPSSIATCRICGKLIPRGEFRFAWPLNDPRGLYGAIAAWVHASCANLLVPPLYSEWQVKERAGWPEYELGEATVVEAGVDDDAAATEDLTKMSIEVWLELYCAGWLEVDAAERVELLTQIQAEPAAPAELGDTVDSTHIVNTLKPIDEIPGMRCTLLRFQKEGVAWMVHQEANERTFGGILADEMGMGKTIQTIGCLLMCPVYGTKHPKRLALGADFRYPPAHPGSDFNIDRRRKTDDAKARLLAELAEAKEEPPPSEAAAVKAEEGGGSAQKKQQPRKKATPKKKAAAAHGPETVKAEMSAMTTSDKCRLDEAPEILREGATLIVAPLAAVLQWQSELAKFAPSLNVLVYHGANRTLLVDELEIADVVITTYPTIEADFRAVVSKHKLKCQYCGRMFLPSKLRLHLRDMCGPDAVRTEKQALRERKAETAKKRTMESVRIGGVLLDSSGGGRSSSVPTVANIYKEIMHQAGRHEEAENFAAAPWLRPRPRRQRTNEIVPEAGVEAGAGTGAEASAQRDQEASARRPADCEMEDEAEHGVACPSSEELESPYLFRDASALNSEGASDCSSLDEASPCLVVRLLGIRHLLHDTNSFGAALEETPLTGAAAALAATEHPGEAAASLFEESRGVDGAVVPPLEVVLAPEIPLQQPMSESAPPISSAKIRNPETWLRGLTEAQLQKARIADLVDAAKQVGIYGADAAAPKKRALVDIIKNWRSGSVSEAATPFDQFAPSSKRPRRAATRTRELVQTLSNAYESESEDSFIDAVDEDASSSDVVMPSSSSSSDDDAELAKLVSDESSVKESSPSASSDEELVISPPPPKRAGGGKAKKSGKRGGGGFGAIAKKAAAGVETGLTSDNDTIADLNYVDLSASPLHAIKWNRIVLDEAHRIKSHITNTCKSIFALKSCGTRWCLTGTPLQNRVNELYSLLRFIQYYPYAYYFCSKRDCQCSTLNYAFDGAGSYCVTCGHTKMTHFSYFNRKIARPIITYGAHGEGALALEALRRDVLKEVLLRRTKVERAADVNLPPLEVLIRKEELSQPEMDFYESLYKQSKTKFDTYTVAGTILHNFAHVFDLLSRLRQAVDHPYMIVHGSLAQQSGSAPIPSYSHSTNDVCGICQEDIETATYYRSACDHRFDRSCLDEYLREAPVGSHLGCPVCYQSLSYSLYSKATGALATTTGSSPSSVADDAAEEDDDNLRAPAPLEPGRVRQTIMSRINPAEFASSTKIEVLLQELQASAPDSKAIVFSQFTAFLHLIEFRLKREGVKCVVFTGSLSMEARQNIILNFIDDPALKVILISLKAGGEGLNLQVANQIYLMDPWWNPAAEMQAIQRAHRIGQTRAVRAVRIIAKNTIEERILQLQEKKQLVFNGTLHDSNQEFQKLSADDLKFLFQ